jgi:hypothetical protein
MQAFNKLASKNLAFEGQICRNLGKPESASFSSNFALEIQDSKEEWLKQQVTRFIKQQYRRNRKLE